MRRGPWNYFLFTVMSVHSQIRRDRILAKSSADSNEIFFVEATRRALCAY